MENIKAKNIILLILKLMIYSIFLYYLHTKAVFLKFSVYSSYSLPGKGLLTSIIHSMISVLIGYLCARILWDVNKLMLILLSIITFLIVAINKETYVAFITMYSSFFIIIGILLYRKKKD